MSGHEIITIHLGPYSNYVGAHLWNLDYTFMFGSSAEQASESLSKVNDDEAQENTELRSNPNVLFRLSKLRGAKNAKYIPRAVFCDHNGAVPSKPLSILASKERAKASQNAAVLDNDPLHLAWAGAWTTPETATSPVAEETDTTEASWHSLLLPALQPLSNAPRTLCLAPGPQTISSSLEWFTQGKSLAQAITTNGDTYLETILEVIRWHAEDCDSPQAFRILCDADNAWAGLCADLCSTLAAEYAATPILVFSASAPVDIFSSTPYSPYPYLWATSESAPSCPVPMANISGTNIPGELATLTSKPLQVSYANFVKFLSANTLAHAHTRRGANVALLLASLSEFDNILHCPVAIPHQQDLVALLASTSYLSRSHRADAVTEAATDAVKIPSTSLAGTGISIRHVISCLTRAFPSASFAYHSAAAIALALHSVLSPVYFGREEGDITVGNIVQYIKPRPKLCVAAVAAVQAESTTQRLFLGAAQRVDRRVTDLKTLSADEREEEQKEWRLHNKEHKGGMTIFTPLLAPAPPQVKALQLKKAQFEYEFSKPMGVGLFSEGVGEEDEDPAGKGWFRKLTSFSVLQGSEEIERSGNKILPNGEKSQEYASEKSDPEYLFRAQYSLEELDRAIIPRHSIAVAHHLPCILPPHFPKFPLLTSHAHRDHPCLLGSVPDLHVTWTGSVADTRTAIAAEMFTNRAMGKGFSAARHRLQQATKVSFHYYVRIRVFFPCDR